MSAVNLNDLIAKKTYVVPQSKELIPSLILSEIEDYPSHLWIYKTRKKSGIFYWNFERRWALNRIELEGSEVTESNMEYYEAEYRSNVSIYEKNLLRNQPSSIPYEFRYIIHKAKKKDCVSIWARYSYPCH